MSRVVAYVDGFNLYHALRDKGWKRYYWLDPVAFVRDIVARPGDDIAVNNFTTRISARGPNNSKQRRQNTFLEAIETLPNVRLHFGHFLESTRRCRQCHYTWPQPEEKMTDVNIAVELLQDAFDDRFDVALVVSADSNLVPPIAAVRRRFPKKKVTVAFPPDRRSTQLAKTATEWINVSEQSLRQSQLPDRVTKSDGYVQ